jgi:hypothetical protein
MGDGHIFALVTLNSVDILTEMFSYELFVFTSVFRPMQMFFTKIQPNHSPDP